MRFLSKYGEATFPAIRPVEMPLPTGQLHVQDPGVLCQFEAAHITEYEFDLAVREFDFNGGQRELDGATPVSPRHRIGVFDTDQAAIDQSWSDETKEIVERALLEKCQNSNIELVRKALIDRNDFADIGHRADTSIERASFVETFAKTMIFVEPQQVPRPWNTYDELVAGGPGRTKEVIADRIATITKDIGADVEGVIAYEQLNRGRVEVVEALEKLLPEQAEAEDDSMIVNH